MISDARDNNRMSKLLDKYELSMPVSPEFQDFSSGMEKSYKEILKKTGRCGFFYGLYISLYFVLKKAGVTFSIAKILVSMAAIVSVSSALYFTAGKTFWGTPVEKTERGEQTVSAVGETKSEVQEKSVVTKKPAIVLYSVGIKPFISKTVDQKILFDLTQAVQGEFNRIKGNNFSKVINEKQIKDVSYAVLGSVEKVDSFYILVIKIVDAKTSSLLNIFDETAASPEELFTTGKKLSAKAALGMLP